MKLVRTVKFHPGWLAVIPLVNALFLVLAFFSLGSTFILQPGVRIELPSSPFGLQPDRNPLILSIVPGPRPEVWIKDRKFRIEDVPKVIALNKSADPTVIIRADRLVPYHVVSELVNSVLAEGFRVVLAGQELKPATSNP